MAAYVLRPSEQLTRPVLCLLLVLAALNCPAAAAGRSLTQDALSNSNGCLATIPKCEPGACATRNVMGAARWVCLRCLSNYDPVVDASGQDNIMQCVCPKGFFEGDSTAKSCTRCPANTYCSGGDKVENPTSRGNNMTCGANLVTRNTGARSQSDCLAPAGYARTSPTTATACARSEYAPQFNRLAKCLRCQSGLDEPTTSALSDGQRNSKRAVCKIPPGKYVSQGLVRICPQGFYRENWVDFDAAIGTLCLPCRPGITTEGAGAGLASLCNRVLPGYGIDIIPDPTQPNNTVPTLPTNRTDGLPNATVCDIGYYSIGGYCAACPSDTVTGVQGAKSVEECMVAPGYFATQSTPMTSCAAGTFREGWVMFSDAKATSCTPCGDSINSEPRDLDENPRVQNGTLTRATSASCFILAGQGMIAQGKNLFVAKDCPENTYGAAGKVYGWAAAPCKPCPRNMITDGLTRVNNSDVCINDDGFGYASEGASRCAPGFYSAKGSRKPCQQCPVGRTTLDLASAQALATDCFVKPGSGVVKSTVNSTDAFNPNTTGLDNITLSQLPVLECPIGYIGVGNSLGAKCVQCSCGSTTQAPGSSLPGDCNVCQAGFGKPDASANSTCTACPYGTYQPGTFQQCLACPSTSFYSPVDGKDIVWTSNGTTLFTNAYGEEACVPWQSQLSPEAGQAYFSAESSLQLLLATTSQQSLAACMAVCPSSTCCFAQYDFTTRTCKMAMLNPVAATAASGLQLLYKLPPSTMGSASSIPGSSSSGSKKGGVKGKMIASGYYSTCSIPAANATAWLSGAGTNLGPDARTFAVGTPVWHTQATQAACQRACEESNVCWGFFYDPTTNGGSCLFRGGVDALATRSFFLLPTAADLASLNWAAGPAPPCGAAAGGSNSNSGNSSVSGGSSTSNPSSPAPQPMPTVPAGQPSPTGNDTKITSIIVTIAGQWGVIADNAPGTANALVQGNGGPGVNATLGSPTGLARDAAGNLFFSDSSTSTVWRLDAATNTVNVVAGLVGPAGTSTQGFSGDGGPALSAKLNVAAGLALWGNSLYIADTYSSVVRRVNLSTGVISTFAGKGGVFGYSGDGGAATNAELGRPEALAVDPRNGDLLISDIEPPRIRRVSAATGRISTFAGNGDLGQGSGSGMGGPAPDADINVIKGLDVDAAGNVYLASQGASVVFKVDTAGIISIVCGQPLTYTSSGDGGLATAATLNAPTDVKVDAAGNLFVADTYGQGSVIRRIDSSTGIINTIVGNATLTPWWSEDGFTQYSPPSGDNGPPAAAWLGQEQHLLLGPTDMYVADSWNFAVRKVTNFAILR